MSLHPSVRIVQAHDAPTRIEYWSYALKLHVPLTVLTAQQQELLEWAARRYSVPEDHTVVRMV